MKKLLTITCILCIFFHSAPAMNTPILSNATSPDLVNSTQALSLSTLKIKEVEKLLGRKMKLKEKIGFLILKQKLKNQLKSKQNESSGLADLAFIFGVGAVVLFAIGFAAPSVFIASLIASIIAIVSGTVAKKRDPSNWKAGAAKLLGWITLGLIVILFALVIAAFSSIF